MFVIVDFIKDVVSNLVFTEPISNLISNPTESQFDSCNTHHVTKGNYIIIDSIEYKVIDFEINSWIAVKGEVPITATEYTIPAPNYFNGTPMQVQNVLANIRSWRNKLPMVYLLEIIREQRFNSRTNKLSGCKKGFDNRFCNTPHQPLTKFKKSAFFWWYYRLDHCFSSFSYLS